MSVNKIGCAILTCNRDSYVSKLLETIDCNIFHEILVIDDSGKPERHVNFGDVKVIFNKKNLGVGKAKNIAFQHLLQHGCTDIFLIEDDVIIKDNSVFDVYINTSRKTGIQHFNFAFHGDDNYTTDRSPAIRLKLDYSNNISVSLYPNVYGAFSYYTRLSLERAGLMDEFYYNAMEHVDHTNEIIKNNMHPPFRWFADITDSQKYISEIDIGHSGSEIRKEQKWVENFHKAADYFAKKQGFDVRIPTATVASKEEVVHALKQIKKVYGRK